MTLELAVNGEQTERDVTAYAALTSMNGVVGVRGGGEGFAWPRDVKTPVIDRAPRKRDRAVGRHTDEDERER